MDIFNVLSMIGGLALFLYGMNLMGDGLSKMAGGKLESILERLTTKKVLAVLLGAGITGIIQSSSAVTVMVVGFVNSGIMKLTQAVGVIMGANIGTTVTSWILTLTGVKGDTVWVRLLKPSSFSPVFAIIGIILIMMTKGASKKKDIGSILLGFAILMFGMETMSGAVSGLANNTSFTKLMIAFSNPILGMAIGTILTAIIQSSSASVGILQALCTTGAVNYSVALPIIMGQNIGTCVTSFISSIGANKNAKRAAMIHLYFNLIGTVIFMIGFYLINSFVNFAFLKESANVVGIAVIHSLFNIGATILFLPFSNLLVKLAKITIPDGKEKEKLSKDIVSIDKRFLEHPSFAVAICKRRVCSMAKLTKKSMNLALDVLNQYDEEKAKEVVKLESINDKNEDILGSYLVKLSSQNLTVADSQTMSVISHSISNFESISDHAMEIVKIAEKLNSAELEFSGRTKYEIETLCRAVNSICSLTVKSFCEDEIKTARHVKPLEEVIDTLSKKIKRNYIKRLKKGKYTIELGLRLEDILTEFERVAGHCSNIAVEMITSNDNGHYTHGYIKNFTDEERESFYKEYDELIKKYSIAKEDVAMLEEK